MESATSASLTKRGKHTNPPHGSGTNIKLVQLGGAKLRLNVKKLLLGEDYS